MLVDEVVITVKAGNGGDGAVSFRREKYVPKGGPDGGDGGNGGVVCFMATESAHGLARFKGKKDYRAEDGERGGKNKRHGINGEDLLLKVPVGTRITEILEDGSERLVSDLATEGHQVVVARGGKGGKGNWHFRGPTNQVPMEFEAGTPGQRKTLRLSLQLIADVGLIGLPNAGKSTLLSVISNARPKIANYPFTTLEPNLGMVHHYDAEFVVADIPGLIEGASEGRGLGHEFLKHVQRTSLLVHLIAATEENPEQVYQTVRTELSRYDEKLEQKDEIIVLSKIDLVPDWQELHADFIKKYQPLAISAATKTGISELLTETARRLAH